MGVGVVYPVVVRLDDQAEALLVSPDQGGERGNHVDRLELVEVRQLERLHQRSEPLFAEAQRLPLDEDLFRQVLQGSE